MFACAHLWHHYSYLAPLCTARSAACLLPAFSQVGGRWTGEYSCGWNGRHDMRGNQERNSPPSHSARTWHPHTLLTSANDTLCLAMALHLPSHIVVATHGLLHWEKAYLAFIWAHQGEPLPPHPTPHTAAHRATAHTQPHPRIRDGTCLPPLPHACTTHTTYAYTGVWLS